MNILHYYDTTLYYRIDDDVWQLSIQALNIIQSRSSQISTLSTILGHSLGIILIVWIFVHVIRNIINLFSTDCFHFLFFSFSQFYSIHCDSHQILSTPSLPHIMWYFSSSHHHSVLVFQVFYRSLSIALSFSTNKNEAPTATTVSL